MKKASGQRNQKKKSRSFDVDVHVLITNKKFMVKAIEKDMKVSQLKDRTETATGIPLQLQRLHYIDDGELLDDHTLRSFDIVPGATLKLKVWNQWNTLVQAVAENDFEKVLSIGVTPDTQYKTAISEYMTATNKTDWLAERAFVALFIATHHGHQELCQKLISKGANVNGKTASGRSPLHMAAIMGHETVLRELLEGGADMEAKDKDGKTALDLVKELGHKGCQRQLIQFEWQNRAKKRRPATERPRFAHQYFDSSLKTFLHGSQAQMYCQQLLPPGEFEGTGLSAPRRKEKSAGVTKPRSALSELTRLNSQDDDGNRKDSLEYFEDLPSRNADQLSWQNENMKTRFDSLREYLARTESTNQHGNTGNSNKHDKTKKLSENQSNSTQEDLSKTDRSVLVSGDLIDVVIAKKLQEQRENGVHGLPYDLWLACRDNSELYQALRDRGQLETMLQY